jgi:hypothetical protein
VSSFVLCGKLREELQSRQYQKVADFDRPIADRQDQTQKKPPARAGGFSLRI